MPTHPTLKNNPCDLIDGEYIPLEGDAITSINPAHPDQTLWVGSPVVEHVDKAVAAARRALPEWSAWPIQKRINVLRRYQAIAAERKQANGELICDETGKAMWDSQAEASILAGKVDITLDNSEHGGFKRVEDYEFNLSESRVGRCNYKPHGVMAVIGPFNFPMHLPNGHIIPALLMGNTIVFKPSEKTPATGQALVEMLQEALDAEGAPKGVINLVQGAAESAVKLTTHTDIDGILFTGSWPVGRRILEANLDRPGRIVALELGGNNPTVVMPDAHLEQAAIEVARAAFITTGQRCTCTRRLIVHEDIADRFIHAIAEAGRAVKVGDPRSEDPVFIGPMISQQARDDVLAAQERFISHGAEPVLKAEARNTDGGFYITPGVLKVDRFIPEESDVPGCDVEVFGPLLRVTTVSSLDEAIQQANATRYGLAASIFTTDPEAQQRFVHECRAGCVNVNTGTAGASSKLPFGGLGLSGNHRPAGSLSLDYCAYPVASMIESGDSTALPQGMTFDANWLNEK